jgi:hypothetical protein
MGGNLMHACRGLALMLLCLAIGSCLGYAAPTTGTRAVRKPTVANELAKVDEAAKRYADLRRERKMHVEAFSSAYNSGLAALDAAVGGLAQANGAASGSGAASPTAGTGMDEASAGLGSASDHVARVRQIDQQGGMPDALVYLIHALDGGSPRIRQRAAEHLLRLAEGAGSYDRQSFRVTVLPALGKRLRKEKDAAVRSKIRSAAAFIRNGMQPKPAR